MNADVEKAVERLDACIDATDEDWQMMRQALHSQDAEITQLKGALRQAHKDYGFEIRDPNGTIWQECERLQKENEQLRKERKCRHMFGADGDGSSCYLCGSPNPRHKY